VIPGSLGFGLKLVSMLAFLGLIAMMLYVTGFDRAELRTIRQFLLTGSILAYSWAMTAMGKGGSAALSGAMKGARGLQDRAAAARTARAEVRAGEWEPPVMASAPAAPAPARAMVHRADPAPAAASYAPEPLAAAPAWNAPSTLRAEPRRFDAPSDLPKEKLGFLARMRRVVEPEPELIEPPLSGAAMEAVLPPEDRIKARISDVIRSRARGVGPALITAGMTPVQAAVAARRMEPPVMRPRGPVPLMADTRPGTLPPGAALPQAAETTPQPRSIPAPPPLQPADNMFTAEDEAWDDTDTGWQADDEADDFDPPPLAAPRVPLAADRRPVVQAPVKKAVQPSTRALAEAQPRLRFDDPAPAYELPPLSLLANPVTIAAQPAVRRGAGGKRPDAGIGAGRLWREGRDRQRPPRPGRHHVRTGTRAGAEGQPRDRPGRRHRAQHVGTVGAGVDGAGPQRDRHRTAERAPRKGGAAEILAARDFGDSNMRLPLALGKDIGGDPIVANLSKMPHLLIAGTTGSGKSVAINTMILSLLYKLTPDECRLIMIDPKMLELSVYDGIPHLLSPVVTDPKKAVVALKWVVGEMEERYRKMSKMGVRNIEGYNGRVREAMPRARCSSAPSRPALTRKPAIRSSKPRNSQPVTIPYIVVVVDEMADLMMVAGKEIEACIQRLAQMARASGIHLIMATQRPSVDVITGTIKANFPTRISFQVTSKIDSRTILGEQGAEQLLGMGDMLYMGNGAKITRIHGPFVSDEEVEEIVNHLKSFGPPVYMSGVVESPDDERDNDIDAVLGLNSEGDDTLYDQAVAIVAQRTANVRPLTSSASWASATTRPPAWSSRWRKKASSPAPTTWASAKSWSKSADPATPGANRSGRRARKSHGSPGGLFPKRAKCAQFFGYLRFQLGSRPNPAQKWLQPEVARP
jgi:S-DNA-T family DNA segregation ATPase FtsK/SpoIIIE